MTIKRNKPKPRRNSFYKAQAVISFNRERLYRIPKKYDALNRYLSRGSLRDTILKIYSFIYDKVVIVYHHRYCYFLDTDTMIHDILGKSVTNVEKSRYLRSREISNHRFNMLCAMGLLNKVYQKAGTYDLLNINVNFMNHFKDDYIIPINVFSIRKYTDDELKRIDERCRRLLEAKISVSNISADALRLAPGLEDIADEVYFLNGYTSTDRRFNEGMELMNLLETLIDEHGFATKQMIFDNLVLENANNQEYELKKVMKMFRARINEKFNFKPPTKKQQQQWNLPTREWIYTKKDCAQQELKSEQP